MAERHWTMRILAGVHVGAEVTLADEEAVIGSDVGCDFVLEDGGLAPRHISLRVGETGVLLTVLDAAEPVYVDGLQVEGGVALEPYQVVSIGGLSLAVGPAQRSWPHIDLPLARASGGPAQETQTATGEDASTGTPGPQDGQAPGPEDDAAPGSPARPRRRTYAALLAGSGLVVVLPLLSLLTPKELEEKRAEPAEAIEKIEEIASRYAALVQARVQEGDDASIAVTGNIDTEKNRLLLLDELAGTGIRAAVHIVSNDELAEFATSILEQSLNRDERNKVDVLPVAHAPGELVFLGYVEEQASLDQTRAILARDLKESRGLTYKIQTKADRLSVLRNRLDDQGFGDRFYVQQLADSISLFGPLRSAEELPKVVDLVKDFNGEFDSRPLLRLEGTDSFLGVSTIDLDVRAVVLGESIHVILQDGASYRAGSRIADDYVVKTITEQYMILERPPGLAEAGEAGEQDLAYLIFERV